MNTNRTGMRTVLAAAAAGALIMGSAAGAMAAPKEKPAPQTTVKLQSVSIKGHSPIDLAKLPANTPIKLRATVRDPQRTTVLPATTVGVKLAVYDKKVGGTEVGETSTTAVPLTLTSAATAKNKRYAGEAPLTIWGTEQIKSLTDQVQAKGRAYICIEDAEVSAQVPSLTVKNSVKVQKRLGERKGKAVRDCVKVINSAAVPAL